MKKKIILISLLLILLSAAYASDLPTFKLPGTLHEIGTGTFVDEKGHNIQIIEYTDTTKDIWFENDTDYTVQPYEKNDSFYIYADDENDCGILEIVEVNGVKYIVNSWTPNGSKDAEIIANNLLEFNRLNNLTPIKN